MTATETLEQVIAERDALRAEVARLRACLPKWQKSQFKQVLSYQTSAAVAFIYQSGHGWQRVVGASAISGEDQLPQRAEDARRSVEEILGLPTCEVVND